MKHKLIALVEKKQADTAGELTKKQGEAMKTNAKRELPKFAIGDTVEVHHWIELGEKGRTQVFAGVVISRKGEGSNERFTVRRIVQGEGVERVFPIHSPKISKIEVKKQAIVRRAKLYYLRDRIGSKATRLKERKPANAGAKKPAATK
jgi:large subunit ribosomal protein L19